MEAVFIKDNHVAAGSVGAALVAARLHAPGLPRKVEVDTLDQLDEALARETGVDFLAVGALTHSVVALDLGLDLR